MTVFLVYGLHRVDISVLRKWWGGLLLTPKGKRTTFYGLVFSALSVRQYIELKDGISIGSIDLCRCMVIIDLAGIHLDESTNFFLFLLRGTGGV